MEKTHQQKIEQEAEKYSKEQGTNYPVSNDYRNMIITQIKHAYQNGAKFGCEISEDSDIISLEKERLEWSLVIFSEATALSSLIKLKNEIEEVEFDLENQYHTGLPEEYADCLMCLFDSAGRVGITPEQIFKAFELKLEKNKKRAWKKNPDNTYSHT